MLKLQPYDLRIKCIPGKYMAATLSRACLEVKPNNLFDEELSRVIYSLFTNLPITPTNLNDFRVATSNDSSLMIVKT